MAFRVHPNAARAGLIALALVLILIGAIVAMGLWSA